MSSRRVVRDELKAIYADWRSRSSQDARPEDDRTDMLLRPSHLTDGIRFVYPRGTIRVPESVAPNTKNVDHVIAAEVDVTNGARGVLACCGGQSGGWTLFTKNGHLHWEHNWYGATRFKVSSTVPLPLGHHVLSASVLVDQANVPGTGGNVVLRIDDDAVGGGRFDRQVAHRFTVGETFDVGCDTATPVSEDYASPFPFTGALRRVMVEVRETRFRVLTFAAQLALTSEVKSAIRVGSLFVDAGGLEKPRARSSNGS